MLGGYLAAFQAAELRARYERKLCLLYIGPHQMQIHAWCTIVAKDDTHIIIILAKYLCLHQVRTPTELPEVWIAMY